MKLMTEKKNISMEASDLDDKQETIVDADDVDVETVMKGAELVKSKYELLYADIIEEKKGQ